MDFLSSSDSSPDPSRATTPFGLYTNQVIGSTTDGKLITSKQLQKALKEITPDMAFRDGVDVQKVTMPADSATVEVFSGKDDPVYGAELVNPSMLTGSVTIFQNREASAAHEEICNLPKFEIPVTVSTEIRVAALKPLKMTVGETEDYYLMVHVISDVNDDILRSSEALRDLVRRLVSTALAANTKELGSSDLVEAKDGVPVLKGSGEGVNLDMIDDKNYALVLASSDAEQATRLQFSRPSTRLIYPTDKDTYKLCVEGDLEMTGMLLLSNASEIISALSSLNRRTSDLGKYMEIKKIDAGVIVVS